MYETQSENVQRPCKGNKTTGGTAELYYFASYINQVLHNYDSLKSELQS